MANLNKNNYNNLKLVINKDEYWDFFVNKDSYGCYKWFDGCLITYIDLCDSECYEGDKWIYSKKDYAWEKSIAVGHTMNNISYTGVDNGLFNYRRDMISNKEFVDIFTKSTYDIEENDYRLKLHAVSGSTLLFDYPLHKEECCTKLNGGFYQGFFKTECNKYQVLPSKFNDGDIYCFEFTLKKCDFEKESEKTLNDKHPNNKGIFFFLGTRAENKWIFQYDKDDRYNASKCYDYTLKDYLEENEYDKFDDRIEGLLEPNVEFDGYDPFELGDYTNYKYYDENLYKGNECDWDDMYDYLEIDTSKKAVIIDESNPYQTLELCCDCDVKKNKTILTPFFKGCGCPISYKKTVKEINNCAVSMCDEFGDDYIAEDENIMSLSDAVEYLERELDIRDFEYETDNNFMLSEANQYYFYTDNKFLLFNRTKTGHTVSSFIDGTQFMFYGRKNIFKGNLFILMNRTKTGYTVNNIDSLRNENLNYYNPYADTYDNALAFRITDDGEIGYRLITIDCEKEGDDKTLVLEGYSNKGIIPSCEWFTVCVKTKFLGGDKMKFYFYVNGKLMYITKELPRIKLKYLNDLKEKQEGVPYNISLGGGSQGLAETVQFNYMLDPERVYPIEENFGGSFIGYINSFKMYDCLIGQETIIDNYKNEMNKLKEVE